jgi:hypothetical protein
LLDAERAKLWAGECCVLQITTESPKAAPVQAGGLGVRA